MRPLAALLAERGISQYELRRRTHLNPKTISNAYRGESSVSTKTWVKIAKALDVKPADLVPGADDERGVGVRSMTDASE
jgi:transcriptional regulator with XRE-family HTH domain